MKVFWMLIAVFFLCSCQTIHVTKQYYNEYINPKADVDYEVEEFDDFPEVFLAQYYHVDAQLVTVREQIEMLENPSTQQVAAYPVFHSPWIRDFIFLDSEYFHICGSEYLKYDYDLQSLLGDMPEESAMSLKRLQGKSFLVNTMKTGAEAYRHAFFDVDVAILFQDFFHENFGVLVDSVSAFENQPYASEVAAATRDTKKYSGDVSVHGRTLYWIRSVAVENVVYFYLQGN